MSAKNHWDKVLVRGLRLSVKPGVRAIDTAGGVMVKGFTVPALAARSVEADIDLKEGRSFLRSSAGLLTTEGKK
jgi:Flp pilus assembly secretin CpaC